MSDVTRSERAERRRREWTEGVARSFAEMEQRDLEFLLAATPAERLRGATELMYELLRAEAESGAGARLQRTVGGTRPRRG